MNPMLLNVSLQAEALFVSLLQCSQHPNTAQVRAAVNDVCSLLAAELIAALVAQEFGDHPDAAVCRMRWCCVRIAEAYT